MEKLLLFKKIILVFLRWNFSFREMLKSKNDQYLASAVNKMAQMDSKELREL